MEMAKVRITEFCAPIYFTELASEYSINAGDLALMAVVIEQRRLAVFDHVISAWAGIDGHAGFIIVKRREHFAEPSAARFVVVCVRHNDVDVLMLFQEHPDNA